jgi:hypothetical protein
MVVESLLAKHGNTHSKAENMSEEANARRIAGAIRGWASCYKKDKGITPMTKKEKRQNSKDVARGHRGKIRLTVAKEAREIQDMARQSAAQAMEVARQIMVDPLERASDRMAAASFITERAYGKATQTNVNAQVDTNGTKKEIGPEELDRRIEKALRGVEELTGRASKPKAGPQRSVNVRKRYRNTSGTTVH